MKDRVCIHLALAICLTSVAVAQKVDTKGNPVVVDASDEPHHVTLWANTTARVFAREIGPQKQTEPFRYAHDFLEIDLSDSELKVQISPALMPIGEDHHVGSIRFNRGPQYRMIRNNGPVATHRAIVIEVMNASTYGTAGCDVREYGCVQDYTAPPEPTFPEKGYALALDRDTVRVTDVQIIPGESWKSTVSLEDFVVVPVSDVQLLETSMTDDARQFKKNSGEVAWAPEAFLQGTIKNDGDTPAQFVVVEFKK